MQQIPDEFMDLVNREKKTFPILATVLPDNSPQATPVWFEYREGEIWINTARGRVKDRNMQMGSRVALLFLDPDNPYRYLQVRGDVIGITEEGAEKHIDDLSLYYTGRHYSYRSGEVRVIYRISLASVQAKG